MANQQVPRLLQKIVPKAVKMSLCVGGHKSVNNEVNFFINLLIR